MAIQVSGTSVISDGRLIQNLNGLIIPSGNTASRPGSPAEGQIYHNTETDEFEVYATVSSPAGYTTIFSGGGPLYMASRSWTPSSPVDTDYGIQFLTNEKMKSTNGKEHRISYDLTVGYSGGTYYTNPVNKSNVTLPADGTEISVGAVAFTFSGVQQSIVLEEYSSGGTTTDWQKIGAY